MSTRIGLLLPRSTDYPAIGYDILQGLQCNWKNQSNETPQVFTENIGFGENTSLNYAKAEKLFLQDGADILMAYCSAANAEPLYQLADTLQKPFINLNAGMELPKTTVSPYCYHISLQGIHACNMAGYLAGSGNRKVLMATSFYDGGYRGPLFYDRGLSEAGGSVCGNYVSAYKLADFSIEPYLGLLQQSRPDSVAACFSSYLAELFFKGLNEKNGESISRPFYCSPFMAEEQMLSKCDFPGGEFYTVVPWASSLANEEQQKLKQCTGAKKANLFHLLGWEAAIVGIHALKDISSLAHLSYESPRGTVSFHPKTHYTYAPLYKGQIMGDENGKCKLQVLEAVTIEADQHQQVMEYDPGALVSGWKNNYLCI